MVPFALGEEDLISGNEPKPGRLVHKPRTSQGQVMRSILGRLRVTHFPLFRTGEAGLCHG